MAMAKWELLLARPKKEGYCFDIDTASITGKAL